VIVNTLSPVKNRQITIGVCFVLVLMVWFVFGQTLTFDFVNYDDPQYVTENQLVQGGITREGVARALTHSDYSFYHPLTTLSHMLDFQMYELTPAGFHLTNVILHTASALLLFLVLRSMTGSLWRSALVAAVFAIHPLRAESVAWVTERKDCLSGVFFMLTLASYVRYVRRPFSIWRYGLVFLCMAACMLSKATVVTLPFVLLLFDYWPLGRWGQRSEVRGQRSEIERDCTAGELSSEAIGEGGILPSFSNDWKKLSGLRSHPSSFLSLVLEKTPFFLLAAAVSVVMVLSSGESMHSLEGSPLSLRLGNAVVSYVTYIFQFFMPINLAVLYPYPTDAIPFWKSGGSVLFLGAITLFVFRRAFSSHISHSTSRKSSFRSQVSSFNPLLIGWLWYLGMLFSMIGIVQAGQQAHADRYTYLSQIGLIVMVVWGLGELFSSRRVRRWLVSAFSLAGLVALMSTARVQTAYWRNTIPLLTHTLACTENNFIIHGILGSEFIDQGEIDRAISQYKKALRIYPDFHQIQYNFGNAYVLGGEREKAIEHYERAIQLNPGLFKAHYNLGVQLVLEGRLAEGIDHLLQVVRLRPDFSQGYVQLGNLFFSQGDERQTILHYEKAIQLQSQSLEVWNNLSIAYAEEARWEKAVKTAQQALVLAERQANLELAASIRSRREAYRQHVQALEK